MKQKKAERYFKERKIKFQLIDLLEKGISKREFESIKTFVGGIDNMIDFNSRDKDGLALLKYIVDADKEAKLLENQHLLETPIVRDGKRATIGYTPEIWKTWK